MDCALVNRVRIDAARRDFINAVSWCEQHLGQDSSGAIWNIEVATGMLDVATDIQPMFTTIGIDFCFARREDAMLFSLTWA